VPPHHGRWPHHTQRILPVLPEPRQHHPEDPIQSGQPRSRLPSTRRVAVAAPGSAALTLGACERWISMSQAGSQAI
jgi:hypothetical protein